MDFEKLLLMLSAQITILNEKTYNDLLPETCISDQGINYLNRSALIDIKIKSLREKDKIDVLALQKLGE